MGLDVRSETFGLYRMVEKSSPLAFQWSMALRAIEHIDAADHFVNGAEAELRHDFAHFLSQ